MRARVAALLMVALAVVPPGPVQPYLQTAAPAPTASPEAAVHQLVTVTATRATLHPGGRTTPTPARASRSERRPPLTGGPITTTGRPRLVTSQAASQVAYHPRPFEAFTDAPHTHAGLRVWLSTLGWPWQGIGTCESLRDDSWPSSSSSWARGVFQFLPSTWASLGLTGDPAAASWRDQLDAARRLRARDGLAAWDCARILGYV